MKLRTKQTRLVSAALLGIGLFGLYSSVPLTPDFRRLSNKDSAKISSEDEAAEIYIIDQPTRIGGPINHFTCPNDTKAYRTDSPIDATILKKDTNEKRKEAGADMGKCTVLSAVRDPSVSIPSRFFEGIKNQICDGTMLTEDVLDLYESYLSTSKIPRRQLAMTASLLKEFGVTDFFGTLKSLEGNGYSFISASTPDSPWADCDLLLMMIDYADDNSNLQEALDQRFKGIEIQQDTNHAAWCPNAVHLDDVLKDYVLTEKQIELLSKDNAEIADGISFYRQRSDDNTLIDTKISQHQPYDETCPLITAGFGVGPAKDEAMRYSVESGAEALVKQALDINSSNGGKIVLVGDSNARQMYSSLACMARTSEMWKDDDDLYTAAFSGTHKIPNDMRLQLKDEAELFYAPAAGGVQAYGWSIPELRGDQNWLKSCHERKQFMLDTYTYEAANKNVVWSSGDDRFETVLMRPNDHVSFNAGLHPSTRQDNLANLSELLDCMADARSKGEDPGWPRIHYFRTNQQHFQSEDGAHTKMLGKQSGCRASVDGTKNPFLKEELEIFSGMLPMHGFDLNLGDVGRLHLGGNDCSHWTLPGVPDVYIKELLGGIFGLEIQKKRKDKIGKAEKKS